ncbi:serine/threonine/tyrosine-interacting-like protein 1 [Perognathus longimembris pacificus]|uniref:serine/threonine/tyrosine-interacting-like protein 1 n=1 Tax=Perognathus longimembris pacificus TaxID=214514 RepID=UPI00201954A1|nr:serine/threonine/tyrosine-interacting-like protein 1 [Perognathus longimembris pacificus]
MAELLFCEPTRLYNILNQATKLSRLAEPNYLYLFDVRPKKEYDESHVITAMLVKKKGNQYLVPECLDLDCVRYCVVYDKNTSSLEVRLKSDHTHKGDKPKAKPKRHSQQYGPSSHYSTEDRNDEEGDADEGEEDEEEEEEEREEEEEEEEDFTELEPGPAVQFGRVLIHLTRHPVYILRGGYEHFTSLYHFLRTQKIIWMPQELDAFQPYPIEIIPSRVYLGSFKQACDPRIKKDLKIKAHVNVSMDSTPFFQGDADHLLHVKIEDTPEDSIIPHLRSICHFMEIHIELNSAILVFSTLGISRSCAAVVAFLMHHNEETLKRSWTYVKQCKPAVRPNRGLLSQLLEWESMVLGMSVTDITEQFC